MSLLILITCEQKILFSYLCVLDRLYTIYYEGEIFAMCRYTAHFVCDADCRLTALLGL